MSENDKDQIDIVCPSCGTKQKMDADASSKVCKSCKEIICVEDIWAAQEDEYDDYFDYDDYDDTTMTMMISMNLRSMKKLGQTG